MWSIGPLARLWLRVAHLARQSRSGSALGTPVHASIGRGGA
ncbi:hypothetical protein Pd630_LPD03697 [Rhodococcus opacus PD630]|nr:hypothetical protein Pd630_LPD03697 [Rhodococcus opacus PD630]